MSTWWRMITNHPYLETLQISIYIFLKWNTRGWVCSVNGQLALKMEGLKFTLAKHRGPQNWNSLVPRRQDLGKQMPSKVKMIRGALAILKYEITDKFKTRQVNDSRIQSLLKFWTWRHFDARICISTTMHWFKASYLSDVYNCMHLEQYTKRKLKKPST